jgi:hypothetical protein
VSEKEPLAEVDSELALRALVILRAAERAEREPAARVSTEALLHKAGFSYAQIGEIVADKADTVRKRLERADKDDAVAKRGSK